MYLAASYVKLLFPSLVSRLVTAYDIDCFKYHMSHRNGWDLLCSWWVPLRGTDGHIALSVLQKGFTTTLVLRSFHYQFCYKPRGQEAKGLSGRIVGLAHIQIETPNGGLCWNEENCVQGGEPLYVEKRRKLLQKHIAMSQRKTVALLYEICLQFLGRGNYEQGIKKDTKNKRKKTRTAL